MDPQFAIPENWKAPRELNRAVPRETTLTARGRMMQVMGCIFLIAGIPLYVWLHNDTVRTDTQNEVLRSQGVQAEGEITRLWTRDRGREHMVAYAFTANGLRLHGESQVPSNRWDGMQKAGFLPVRYLPTNPAVNHPAAWEAPSTPVWAPFLFVGFLGAAGVFLLWILRRQKQLAAEGTPAPGVVTRCVRIKNGWVVRYRYRAKDGTELNGRDRAPARLDPGTPVCILYGPENPRHSALYPGCTCRVVAS